MITMMVVIINMMIVTVVCDIDGILLVMMDEIAQWCNINNIAFKKNKKQKIVLIFKIIHKKIKLIV